MNNFSQDPIPELGANTDISGVQNDLQSLAPVIDLVRLGGVVERM